MKFHKIGIAKRLILAEKFEAAKRLLRPLADRNAEAQLLLGYLYYGGDLKTTRREAKNWLEKSAGNGNAEALALLATTDFNQGVWSNILEDKTSLALTTKAAKLGSAEAQRVLACAHAHGDGVPQDDAQTRYWDEKAAQQGLAESQNDLALMLLHGIGGEVDAEQAIYWYKESASRDYNAPYSEWAAQALSRIYSGDPYPELTDAAAAEHWNQRANALHDSRWRTHPDWFYE